MYKIYNARAQPSVRGRSRWRRRRGLLKFPITVLAHRFGNTV